MRTQSLQPEQGMHADGDEPSDGERGGHEHHAEEHDERHHERDTGEPGYQDEAGEAQQHAASTAL